MIICGQAKPFKFPLMASCKLALPPSHQQASAS